jgi:hypothetical protein
MDNSFPQSGAGFVHRSSFIVHMTLSLDTTELKKARIRIDDGKKTKRFKFAIYADAVLPRLIKLLAGKKPSALGVVVGPGAFSATRTGVALINALAYGWGVPVAALNKEQFNSSNPLPYGTKPPVSVLYGALPNITKKKII